jgi:ComF family protein
MASGTLILDGARTAARALLDLLMPPGCIACKAPVATPLRFCGDCWSALPVISAARCFQCGLPLPLQWQAESHCLGCLKDPPRFDRAAAAVLYDGPARQALLAFKTGREAYAAPLADAMLRAAPGWVTPETLVVAIPLHRWRLASRGYNQALLLARHIAAAAGGALEPGLIVRVKATRRTRGLSRSQRRRNVEGAFRLSPDARARLAGRPVLLVDDVLTTGATAGAAAGLLKRGGATRVDLLTYARVAAVDVAQYAAPTPRLEDDGESRDLHEVPVPLLHPGEVAAEVQGRRGYRGT